MKQRMGAHGLSSLMAKHVFQAFSPAELRELGVQRIVQTPGVAVLTYPVSCNATTPYGVPRGMHSSA